MNNNKDNKNLVVYGIYNSKTALENGVSELKAKGFRAADISTLFAQSDSNKEFAHEKSTKAPEGATTGATTGAVVGGVLGWLAGIGSLAIPGVGPFIAAGPIMSLLAGAAVGGTVGGVSGALIGLGLPEYEAKRYEGQVKNGGLLLSVHCDNHDWKTKARNILEQSGAQDISSTSEAAADSNVSNRPYEQVGNA